MKLCQVLESGSAGVDARWFANQLARAAIPTDVLVSSSVAVDGTDVETWGALHGEAVTVELDGEATETQLSVRGVPGPKDAGPPSQGPGYRPRRSQALHRRSRRPGRTPLGHQQPTGRSLCRLRAPPGRPGPRGALDQPHRPDHLRTRGPRRDHDLQPGPGRHPPRPSQSSRPCSRPKRMASNSPRWSGTPATRSAKPATTAHPLAQGGHHPDLPAGHPPAGEQALLGRGPPHRRTALLAPSAQRPPRAAGTPSGSLRRREADLRGQVQPAGPLAPGPPRRS